MILRQKELPKRIVCQIFEIQLDADAYDTRIDLLSAKFVLSLTLVKRLLENSKNGLPDTFLPNILIGNMVTKFVRKNYAHLLIDFTVMIRKKGNC